VEATGYRTAAEHRGWSLVYGADYWQEVPGASWRHPAEAYAAWAGRRLPTETEWGLAACGLRYRLWPWGDEWSGDRANTIELRLGGATRSVYAWTASPSRLYGPSPDCDDSLLSVMGRFRVIRGGSWMSLRFQARTSERLHGDPTGWACFASGFRCVRDPGGGPHAATRRPRQLAQRHLGQGAIRTAGGHPA
jgi:formylglycine-generating enzyme